VGGLKAILDGLNDGITWFRTPDVHSTALWFLAGVFVWSGTAKLRRPTLAALALVDFGLTGRVKPRLGVALALSEICLAGSLILAAFEGEPFQTLSASAATVFLATFVALITRGLARGERFACFCFGGASSGLSLLTLTRAVALMALAVGLVFVQPPDDVSPTGRAVLLQGLVAAGVIGFFFHMSLTTRLLLVRRRLTQSEGDTL
jgi:hypothetical protein